MPRTKTAAKRPRPEKGSSSAPPSAEDVPERRYYTNDKHFENFLTTKNKDIIPSHCWDMRFLKNSKLEIYEILDDLDLLQFATCHENRVYDSLVYMFYANLSKQHARKYLSISVNVKGIDIDISVSTLATIFEMDDAPSCVASADIQDYSKAEALNQLFPNGPQYKSGKMSISGLSMDDRILHYTIAKILFPKRTNFTQIHDDELFIMWAIRNDIRLNFPYLILNNMMKHSTGEKFLPYGMILTRIFKEFKVDVKKEVVVTKVPDSSRLCEFHLHKMKFKEVNGVWQKLRGPDGGEEEEQEAEVGAEAGGPSGSGSGSGSQNAVLERLNAMELGIYARMDVLQNQQVELQKSLHGFQNQVNDQMSSINHQMERIWNNLSGGSGGSQGGHP